MAPVTVGHRGKGDRSNGGGQIYLDHPAVDDQHDADGKGIHGQAHKKGLEPQPEQFPGPQGFKLRLQIRDDTVHINGGIPDDDPGTLVDHMLPDIENPHDDVPGIRYDQHRAEGFEYPFEEHPGIHIVHIIFLCHKLDQLITHDKRQDNPGNRDDHRFGEVSDHGKDAAVPCQRRLSHFSSDLAYFGIDRIEHARQVPCDSLDEQDALAAIHHGQLIPAHELSATMSTDDFKKGQKNSPSP